MYGAAGVRGLSKSPVVTKNLRALFEHYAVCPGHCTAEECGEVGCDPEAPGGLCPYWWPSAEG